ncbi:MAG: glycosyltransferase [Flavobacteriales bacterium]|nr:glycosyltransferase [Flavobacteriales bacterium]
MSQEKQITLVLTNRNRDLRIVKNNLDSLHAQSNMSFDFFLVDYGSDLDYKLKLKELLKSYNHVTLIECHTQGQLWNKCRSINIALRRCTTPYFIVGDLDLIFHPDFIQTANELAKPDEVLYFKYGFLNEEESFSGKNFKDIEVDFEGSPDVTGTTMFPAQVLKELNGYDEYYHGWGAEDTDIHIRMSNKGLKVFFFDKSIMVKHQWHPKSYRSKTSTHPFHSNLERMNHAYMINTQNHNRTVVNLQFDWGKVTDELAYEALKAPTHNFKIDSSQIEFRSLCMSLRNFTNEVVYIKIVETDSGEKLKNKIKRVLGKKYIPYLDMESINNLLLEEIILNYRNCPYHYKFDRIKQEINLVINFS